MTQPIDLFPETPREHYRRVPLVQVICQLRFPKLLRIESAPPADFQDRVRGQFPLMQRENPIPFEFPPEIAQFVQQRSASGTFQFMTEDKNYTIGLNSDSISLTAVQYTRWEIFLEHLEPSLAALNEIYKPSFFSRAGLRYQDAIVRSDLGLTEIPWSELLRRELLAELSLPEFEASLDAIATRVLRLKIPDSSGSILLRHGLAQIPGKTELSYAVDWDFFTESKTEVNNAINTLTRFNRLAGRAFRWCITEKLRAALDPNTTLIRRTSAVFPMTVRMR